MNLVIQCKHCGAKQACITNNVVKYVFRCRKCERASKLVLNGKYWLNIWGPYVTPTTATNACKRFKKK